VKERNALNSVEAVYRACVQKTLLLWVTLVHSVCSCDDGSHDVDAAPTRMYRRDVTGELVGERSAKLGSAPHV